MAVYYKWIKGCAPGASLTDGLWTYLKWGTGTVGTNQMPTLHINTGKNDSAQSVDLGYLLTNDMPSPRITNEWSFNSCINFLKDNDATPENGPLGKIHANNGWLNISSYSKSDGTFTALPIKTWSDNNSIGGTSYLGVKISDNGYATEDKWRMKISYNNEADNLSDNTDLPLGVVVHGKTVITTGQTTDVLNNFYAQGGCFLGTQLGKDGDPDKPTGLAVATFPCYSAASSSIQFYRKLVVNNQPVDAQYFNATSDVRAKENIKPASYNALDLINKLPVYIYNYKNNPETVTGILAQDLLKAQPEGLELVSNPNATGENNDYMSIKNDKLMFVLMKAIQEQQEQIEALKAEIEKLKA